MHNFNPLQKRRPVDLHETGQPGLHREVLASQSYMKKHCLKKYIFLIKKKINYKDFVVSHKEMKIFKVTDMI